MHGLKPVKARMKFLGSVERAIRKRKIGMSQSKNFFSLADLSAGIARTLADGIETRIFVGDQAMLSAVQFEPNSKGSIHQHEEEQWGLVIKGSGVRIQDGETFTVKEGDFWLTPGGIEHGFVAGDQGAVVLDIFAPPREAYRTAGDGFS